MQGYIKLYRQIAENPIWLIKPFSEGQAWVDLLCITTFDKGFIKTKNGQIIKLKRGDCGYSQLSLSNRWGWSRGKVKRFLNLLMEQQMIQQKTYGNYTIINILNYEQFQNNTTNNTTNDTINGQQMIQQTDTIKNDKNVEEEEKTFNRYGNYQNVYLKKNHYTQFLNACLSNELMNNIIEEYSINIERGKEKRFNIDYPEAHYLGLMAYLKQKKKNVLKMSKEEPQSHYKPA